ncbi:MAG: PorT family protein [Prolixibacteraceae bacterium]|nr:PorT family protein [Prolixibacteraceae bacterium]
MKKFILTSIFFFFTLSLFAQYEFDLGLKAGLNNSKFSVDSEDFNSSTILSYHVGAFARINLNYFYIQPEAYYCSKGGDIEEIVGGHPLETVSSFNYNVVDVPVLAGFKILNGEAVNIRILAGPVFSFITDSSIETTDSRFSKEYFKDSFFGWQYGIGADFLFLTVDARVENSSGNIYSGNSFTSKNNTFLLTVGIKLL